MSERFVGVDLHKRRCYFTVLDSGGNIIDRGYFDNSSEDTVCPDVNLSLSTS